MSRFQSTNTGFRQTDEQINMHEFKARVPGMKQKASQKRNKKQNKTKTTEKTRYYRNKK